MAPEWEAAMGMDLAMGTTHYQPAPTAPTINQRSHFYGAGELLDLSHAGAHHDFFPAGGGNGINHAGGVAPPPSASASSSFNLSFADEFYIPVPNEEAAELEWLSNFVDDSYPDIPSYPPAVQAAMAAAASARNHDNAASAPPGRGARSKRSRSRAASAAAAAWHSLVPRRHPSPSSSSSSSDLSPAPRSGGKKHGELGEEGGVRRCTHCASEKTPQWRTGPLGPKTLCNACGVRYKSGRLVPEYRPAASPTFVLTQHSNSHRKVMELRRQNELLVLREAASSGSGSGGAEVMLRDYSSVC